MQEVAEFNRIKLTVIILIVSYKNQLDFVFDPHIVLIEAVSFAVIDNFIEFLTTFAGAAHIKQDEAINVVCTSFIAVPIVIVIVVAAVTIIIE